MKIILYDTKQYDKIWFDRLNQKQHQITYVKDNLTSENIKQAKGYDAICAFVNTDGNKQVLKTLSSLGVKYWLQRSMGYNRVDLKAAKKYDIQVFRVPNYSAESIGEHAMTLMLALNRHLITAIKRNQKWNFTLDGLEGKVIYESTIGVIGAGKIGQSLINIANGMGAKILVYDEYAAKHFPETAKKLNFTYTSLEKVSQESDFISLHAPLTPTTKHIINEKTIKLMTKKPILINTSRGELIDTSALVKALKSGQISGAGLDVLENEAHLFYQNMSTDKKELVKKNPNWYFLLNQDNVIITSHQAFFTNVALKQIAQITLDNATSAANNDFDNALQLTSDGKIKNG